MALCFDVKHRANGQSSPSLLAINNDFTLVRQNLCVAANPRFLSLKHQYGALHTEMHHIGAMIHMYSPTNLS